MTKRNEKTGARVAKIAAGILAAKFDGNAYVVISQWRNGKGRDLSILGKNLNAVCASALTQTADKKPKPFSSLSEVRKAVKKGGWHKPKSKLHKPIFRKIHLRHLKDGKGYPG